MDAVFSEWLLHKYFPIAGADGEGDGTGDAGSGDGDAGSGTGDAAGTGVAGGSGDSGDGDAGSGDSGSGDAGSGDGNSGDGDGELEIETRHKAELTDLRAKLAKAEAAAQKAKDDAREARKSRAAKDGNWEQVARERETEVKEANERAEAAEATAARASSDLDDFRREVRVTRIAGLFGFHDPNDALSQLTDEQTGDDKTAERALRKLAQDKPYLVDQRRARGRSLSNGSGSQVLLTKEQMAQMTTAEVNDQWELVEKSLAAIGPRSGGG